MTDVAGYAPWVPTREVQPSNVSRFSSVARPRIIADRRQAEEDIAAVLSGRPSRAITKEARLGC